MMMMEELAVDRQLYDHLEYTPERHQFVIMDTIEEWKSPTHFRTENKIECMQNKSPPKSPRHPHACDLPFSLPPHFLFFPSIQGNYSTILTTTTITVLTSSTLTVVWLRPIPRVLFQPALSAQPSPAFIQPPPICARDIHSTLLPPSLEQRDEKRTTETRRYQ